MLSEVIEHAHQRGLLVRADLADVNEGALALDSGANCVATTLIGASSSDTRARGPGAGGPNLRAVAQLRAAFPTQPIVAEGRYASAADVRGALDLGATSVVAGTAITNVYSLALDVIRGVRESDPSTYARCRTPAGTISERPRRSRRRPLFSPAAHRQSTTPVLRRHIGQLFSQRTSRAEPVVHPWCR